MSDLRVNDLCVRRGEFVLQVPQLEVAPGTLWGVVGESGSGKTTFLLALAGFLPWEKGTLVVDGNSMRELPPEKRRFGLAFQKGALFPHLSLADNVAFGLRAQGVPKNEARQEAVEWLGRAGLADLEDRTPDRISVGQAQRVALVRALAPRPCVLLLDEPFSALDEGNRKRMQDLVLAEVEKREIAAILVSHQEDEVDHLCRGKLRLG